MAYDLQGFETARCGRVTALLRNECVEEFTRRGILEPKTFLSGCRETHHRGRGVPLRVTLDSGENAIVRRYRRAGLAGNFLSGSYLWDPRPLKEAAVSEAARRGGASTPEVLAAVDVVGAAGMHSGFIITREIKDAVPLRERISGADGPGLMTGGVPGALRILHDSGVAHHDLTVDNILVAERGTVWVVDLDGCTACASVRPGRRLRDLRRFRRSVQKNGFTGNPSVWGGFYDTYARDDERLAALRDAWLASFERMLPWYRIGWKLGI